ncbi:di-N-acetylchitobiase-like [Hemitrygon akajei]|uniref:di-N-acetylchitobiase-like n=1 Tax=Hemitrygon akajei TaxID=2704970 RepID=UPI003BF9E02E
MQLLPRSLTGRFWDDDRKAPYFDYLDGNTYHEVWYDDPESISMKVSIMMKLNLRGIGVRAANNIDYIADARARMQAAEMWNAVTRPWWNYQISFHVPWSPHCKNEQCYDFLAISKACDILFVASYDIPNDLRDGCVARSSAPYHRVLSGISDYIRLGIDSRKLVMGVAWYGYDYTCKRFLGVGECELETISRGVPCSYTEARQIPYKDIMQRLPRSLTGRFWDDDWKAPYFDYLDFNTYHEVWYNDPESISMRVSIVKKLQIHGIGVWAANNINYTGDARVMMQAAEMWNAVCPP